MHADFSALAEAIARALAQADADLAAEQAIKGLDALSEVALHPLIGRGLAHAGWGVHHEVLYPGDAGESATNRARDTGRDRCDIVLTPSPEDHLLDPVHADRRVRNAEGTLFAELAHDMEAQASHNAVPPAEALWLEIKAVAQYAYRDGVPGPNRAYASEMVNGPAADVCKLMGDGVIERAAAVLVLFAESESIARHDIAQTAHHLLDMGLPIGVPEVSGVPIIERAGNAHAAVAIFPLRGLGRLVDADQPNP